MSRHFDQHAGTAVVTSPTKKRNGPFARELLPWNTWGRRKRRSLVVPFEHHPAVVVAVYSERVEKAGLAGKKVAETDSVEEVETGWVEAYLVDSLEILLGPVVASGNPGEEEEEIQEVPATMAGILEA